MFERATAIRKIDERDLLDEFEAGQLAVELDDATPQEVIAYALERWGSQVAICTSFQAEGMAILDMAWRIDNNVRIFTVDTGRLHQETYDAMEEVRQRYGIDVEVYFPDAKQVENMVRRFGPNLFQKSVEARLTCCNVRKVEPIRGVLEGLDAWVTGLRRDQSVTRADTGALEFDQGHGGIAKLNPIIGWTDAELWAYADAQRVPIHPLHKKGYPSIGCGPCTRAVKPGEHPRAGRWWWENPESKECGLHPVKG